MPRCCLLAPSLPLLVKVQYQLAVWLYLSLFLGLACLGDDHVSIDKTEDNECLTLYMHHYLTDKPSLLIPSTHAQAASFVQLVHSFALQSQKDLGFLLNPGEGPISAVALYVPVGAATPTHLFSGGADGTLAVWSAGHSWDCLKVTAKRFRFLK